MGRENTSCHEPQDAPITIASRKADEVFPVCFEGVCDKEPLYLPDPSPYRILVANHRYFFKHAFRRYRDQFSYRFLSGGLAPRVRGME